MRTKMKNFFAVLATYPFVVLVLTALSWDSEKPVWPHTISVSIVIAFFYLFAWGLSEFLS